VRLVIFARALHVLSDYFFDGWGSRLAEERKNPLDYVDTIVESNKLVSFSDGTDSDRSSIEKNITI
jgi:hypothetical protein